MFKLLLMVFVALGGIDGLLDRRDLHDDPWLLLGSHLGAIAFVVVNAHVARRRESGAWLGLDPPRWVLLPVAGFVGGFAIALVYRLHLL